MKELQGLKDLRVTPDRQELKDRRAWQDPRVRQDRQDPRVWQDRQEPQDLKDHRETRVDLKGHVAQPVRQGQ